MRRETINLIAAAIAMNSEAPALNRIPAWKLEQAKTPKEQAKRRARVKAARKQRNRSKA